MHTMTTSDFAIPQTVTVKHDAFDALDDTEFHALRSQLVRITEKNLRILVAVSGNGAKWGLYPDEVEVIDAEYTI